MMRENLVEEKGITVIYKINKRWNSSRSGITQKLQKDTSEWVHYHEEYRKTPEDWLVTPYKEMIKFYKKRWFNYWRFWLWRSFYL